MNQDPESQAAAWIGRHDRGLRATEQGEFSAWLGADPRNRAAFDRLASAGEALAGIATDPEVEALADRTLRDAYRSRSRRRVLVFGSLAAAVAIGLYLSTANPKAATGIAASSPPAGHYQLVPSTARRINLPDGSVAELNGNSTIKADFSGAERRLQLIDGEAFFSVAKNPARPFVVITAGGGEVRAVGTAFNVRLTASGAEVIVTEGRVSVERSAGDDIVLVGAGNLGTWTASAPASASPISRSETDDALAWRAQRLEFENTPLSEAVAAVNYFSTRKIVLSGNIATQPITGTIRADSVDGLVRILESVRVVQVQTEADGQVSLHAKP